MTLHQRAACGARMSGPSQHPDATAPVPGPRSTSDPAERPDRSTLEVARDRPTIAADMPAATGRDLVVATPERRLPVVGGDGRVRGVLAVTTDLQFFACRPAPPPH
jgi:hypothetical protein